MKPEVKKGDTLKLSGKRFVLPKPVSQADSGRTWTFSSRPGGWIVATDNAGKRVRLCTHQSTHLSRMKFGFSIGGQCGSGEIIPGSVNRDGAGASDALLADLVAQFPGKVRKILVASGVRVAAGDALILVEAMKMEFSVKAPCDGSVKKVLVTEGQQLSPGDRFVDFEPFEQSGGQPDRQAGGKPSA